MIAHIKTIAIISFITLFFFLTFTIPLFFPVLMICSFIVYIYCAIYYHFKEKELADKQNDHVEVNHG